MALKSIPLFALLFTLSFSALAQSEEDDAIYTVVDQRPSFPGGAEPCFAYLKRELTPLPDSLKGETEVRIYIEFIVRKDGEIDKNSVHVVKGSLPFLNEDAIRVVKKMPPWIPGRMAGKRVNSKFILPIVYK